MENITRTAIGSLLQTYLLMGLNYRYTEKTTLNEKFDIQSGVIPAAGINPALRYFTIGNGGHRMAVGADSIAIPDPIQHRTTDCALFNHLPLVLREPTQDLTAVERAKYALRREETHQNRRYIAYYAKRLTTDNVVPAMEYHTVTSGGGDQVAPWVPDSSNLNPTPPQLSSEGVNVISGDYVSITAKVNLVLTAQDAAELLNVARVIYDDERLAIISEIGLCSGVDKPVTTGTLTYNEAIGVQVCAHYSSIYPMKYNQNGIDLILDIGATEPLFALQASTS